MARLRRLDESSLKMMLLSYPLFLAVDALVLEALVASPLWQIAHVALGVVGFAWLLRAYRAKSPR